MNREQIINEIQAKEAEFKEISQKLTYNPFDRILIIRSAALDHIENDKWINNKELREHSKRWDELRRIEKEMVEDLKQCEPMLDLVAKSYELKVEINSLKQQLTWVQK